MKTNWKNQEASELESYFSYSEFVRRTVLLETAKIDVYKRQVLGPALYLRFIYHHSGFVCAVGGETWK